MTRRGADFRLSITSSLIGYRWLIYEKAGRQETVGGGFAMSREACIRKAARVLDSICEDHPDEIDGDQVLREASAMRRADTIP
jgi:hypothetical protein